MRACQAGGIFSSNEAIFYPASATFASRLVATGDRLRLHRQLHGFYATAKYVKNTANRCLYYHKINSL
jgi:hypothetical protein